MITVFSRFPLREDLTPDEALQEMQASIDWYRGRPGCLRKYICLNWDEGYGYGVYLWDNRELAEAFYAEAATEIERQTGGKPTFTFFDTPVIVDNLTDEVFVNGERVDRLAT